MVIFKILNIFLVTGKGIKEMMIKKYIEQLYNLYNNENINNPYRLGIYIENDYPNDYPIEVLKKPLNSLINLLYFHKIDYCELQLYILRNYKELVLWHKEVCEALRCWEISKMNKRIK